MMSSNRILVDSVARNRRIRSREVLRGRSCAELYISEPKHHENTLAWGLGYSDRSSVLIAINQPSLASLWPPSVGILTSSLNRIHEWNPQEILLVRSDDDAVVGFGHGGENHVKATTGSSGCLSLGHEPSPD